MTENWPKLEWRDADGRVMTIGRIKPFRPTCSPGTLDYNLCGLAVKLEWRYGDVSRILAASREEALVLLMALGPK